MDSPKYWKDIMDMDSKSQVVQQIAAKLAEAFDKEMLSPKGAPVWLNIIYLLDLFNSGTFHGKLSLTIKGNVCDNMKIVEKTNKLQEDYSEIMDLINKK